MRGAEEGRRRRPGMRRRLERERARRGRVESGLRRRACGWWRMTTVVEVGSGEAGRYGQRQTVDGRPQPELQTARPGGVSSAVASPAAEGSGSKSIPILASKSSALSHSGQKWLTLSQSEIQCRRKQWEQDILVSFSPASKTSRQTTQLSSFALLAQASCSSAMAVLDAGTTMNPLFLYAGTSLKLPFLYAIIVGCMVVAVVVAAAMAP
uniref:Uncharacterized protein n=1 Tax=Oryza meridionalis TaxID=40149 RepID=A0A0E0F9F8_9ORYZ